MLQPFILASLKSLTRCLSHHFVIQSSYLLLVWGRSQATRGSGNTELEAPQCTGHWPAGRQLGCQQALCRRKVSVCVEMHRYERTGPMRWIREGEREKQTGIIYSLYLFQSTGLWPRCASWQYFQFSLITTLFFYWFLNTVSEDSFLIKKWLIMIIIINYIFYWVYDAFVPHFRIFEEFVIFVTSTK